MPLTAMLVNGIVKPGLHAEAQKAAANLGGTILWATSGKDFLAIRFAGTSRDFCKELVDTGFFESASLSPQIVN